MCVVVCSEIYFEVRKTFFLYNKRDFFRTSFFNNFLTNKRRLKLVEDYSGSQLRYICLFSSIFIQYDLIKRFLHIHTHKILYKYNMSADIHNP